MMRIKKINIQEYIKYLEKVGVSDSERKLLIEYAARLEENGIPVIWDMKHFSILLGIEYKMLLRYINSANEFYHPICIPKKTEGFRQLEIPTMKLKEIQSAILVDILEHFKVSPHAYAFKKGRSIVDNARKHIDKEYVLNLDLKDFFGTIRYERVFRVFYYYGYTKEVSYMLAKLVTQNEVLPQGVPTSPYLSNVVCLKLDKRLNGLARKLNCTYTRYADDITFSGSVYPNEYLYLVRRIIKEEGFCVNEDKTRIQTKNYRQEVTGIIVNKRLRVNRKYKLYLRQQIYYIKKFGIDNHLNKIGCDASGYKEHLYGIAYFIKMVEQEEGEKWLCELNQINWYY